MEALLPALIAAFLAEWGDKTQLLVIALAARYAKPAPVLAGVALAALINAALSAGGGWLLADRINYRALSLLTALAFVVAGGGALWPAKTPKVATDWRTGAFATALFAFLLVEFGDKTQFVTAALSARSGLPVLAAIGATLGVVAASVNAAALGARLPRVVPVARIRLGVAVALLLIGLWLAARALLLI